MLIWLAYLLPEDELLNERLVLLLQLVNAVNDLVAVLVHHLGLLPHDRALRLVSRRLHVILNYVKQLLQVDLRNHSTNKQRLTS